MKALMAGVTGAVKARYSDIQVCVLETSETLNKDTKANSRRYSYVNVKADCLPEVTYLPMRLPLAYFVLD